MSQRSRRAGSYGRASEEPLLDELSSQAGELAKRWAIALIESAPADEIAAVDLALIASDGPRLVERVLGAAAHAYGGATGGAGDPVAPAGVASLAGAEAPGELARALEALRAVLWEAAVEASPQARSDTRAARRLLETGDAVAAACSELLAAELDALAPEGEGRPDGDDVPAGGARARAKAPPAGHVVIVDERHGALPLSGAAREKPGGDAEAPAFETAISARDARAGLSSGPTQRARPAEDAGTTHETRSTRDAHPTQGPAAWIDSIGAQLAAAETDRRQFAVLLVELLEPFAPPGAGRHTPTLAGVLDERLHERDGLSLTQERAGRYWLVLPGSDRAGAESLKDWLGEAVSSGRGVAAVAIGVAVFPEDGGDAPGLAAQADLDLYAARSQGSLHRRRTGRL